MSRRPRFLSNYSVLVLNGRILDRISLPTLIRLASYSDQYGVVDAWFVQRGCQMFKSWRHILNHLGITIKNIARFCTALVANPTWSPATQNGLSLEENLVFHLWSYIRRYIDVIIDERLPHDMVIPMVSQGRALLQDLAPLLGHRIQLGSFSPATRLNPKEEEALSSIREEPKLQGRSFCVTENGHVCNAMHQAEQGDVVAAFGGAERLFILRPVGERYRLVGEAYVEGLMSGEAYEGLDPDVVDYDIELM
jgi:hypothetical protein